MAKDTHPAKISTIKSKSAASRKSDARAKHGEAKQNRDAKDPATTANPDAPSASKENWPSTANQVLEIPGTGKLGRLAAAVAQHDGATMQELVEATGWLAHSIRAALSRLRKRGMPIILADRNGRKTYRVARELGR